MQKFSVAHRVFLTVFILLLNGCSGNGNSSNNPNVQVNELSNSTTSYDETVHINNCGGKADSEQTKSRSFSTDIQGGIDVGVQQVVVGVISAKYSQSRNASVSQRLVAPAGTNMEFVLRWSEEVHAGNVTVNGSTGTYTANIPIAVEQVSGQDLDGCNGVPALPTTPPTLPTQPPAIQTAVSPSFVPNPKCPSVISRQSIEQWAQIGEVSTKSEARKYIDDFDRQRIGGEFTINTVLPAGVAIVTDFGNGESNIYLTLPVRAIAHYHSYGIFEVLSDYAAIQTGACMTIKP